MENYVFGVELFRYFREVNFYIYLLFLFLVVRLRYKMNIWRRFK